MGGGKMEPELRAELLTELGSVLDIAQHLDAMGSEEAAAEIWFEVAELEREVGLLQDGRGEN